MTDYPCDACGYEGPHAVVGNDGATLTLECGDCHVEFTTPAALLDAAPARGVTYRLAGSRPVRAHGQLTSQPRPTASS